MRSPRKSVLTFSAITLSLLSSAIVMAQTPPAASPHTPGAMQARMEARLKAADTNNDGLISRAEAEQALPQLAKHFDAIDTNKDGQLSPDELKAMGDKMRAQRSHHHHRPEGGSEFMHADENHDGVISRAEAEKVSQKIMQDFDAADTNKDGQLSRDELKAMRTKMWAAHQHGDQHPSNPPQPNNS